MLNINSLDTVQHILLGLSCILLLQLAIIVFVSSSLTKALVAVSSLLTVVVAWLLFDTFGFLSLLVVSFLMWQLFVNARVLSKRYELSILRLATARDGVSLILIATTLVLLFDRVTGHTFVTSASAVAALIWLGVIALVLLRTQFQKMSLLGHRMPSELPTVTIAIPARNETHALSETLDIAVDVSYPKLEILVLDDCSQDTTPQIIRSFARKGVRFISGKVSQDEWLGKNFANQQLYEHSSGEYILFTSVDVHFSKDALQEAIAAMTEENVEILSITPQRPINDTLVNSLYAFSSFVDRGILHPGYSQNSVWLVKKAVLESTDGFKGQQNQVNLVAAYKTANQAVNYQEVVSQDKQFVARKKLSSHIETLLRTNYPRSGSIVNTALGTTFLVFSYILLVQSLWQAEIIGISILALSLVAFYLLSTQVLKPLQAFIATIFMPLAFVFYVALMIVSSLVYELSKLVWKDRNVCIPVLRQNITPDR